jgi:flagellar basal body P-ring formation protein FlgA
MKVVLTAIASIAVSLSICASGFSQERIEIVPVATIYPGAIIGDKMLRDRTADDDRRGSGVTRPEALGKVARRTLLAGAPIAQDAVEEQHSIRNGAAVRMVYSAPDLLIEGGGQALQAGRVGDVIRVRNAETGVIVVGSVAADGSIKVDR